MSKGAFASSFYTGAMNHLKNILNETIPNEEALSCQTGRGNTIYFETVKICLHVHVSMCSVQFPTKVYSKHTFIVANYMYRSAVFLHVHKLTMEHIL